MIYLLSYCPLFTSADFRRRFLSLLSYRFRSYSPSLALSILKNKGVNGGERGLHEFSFPVHVFWLVFFFDVHTKLNIYT